MRVATDAELTTAIVEFCRYRDCVLFAGAGVGVAAGLPTWRDYLLTLADTVGGYDAPIEAAMRDRINANQYLDAAALYKFSKIPEGIKQAAQAKPLTTYRAEMLRPLVSLPWASIVTTNFDRSLLDAWSVVRNRAPLTAELGDPTMRAFPHSEEPMIARVHGRVEHPPTMVLDAAGYAELERDDDYWQLMYFILTNRRCLFVGFSFTDPAVRHVLDLLDKLVGPTFPKDHLALLPEGSEGLAGELLKRNINAIGYRDTLGHKDLWHAIGNAATTFSATPIARPSQRLPHPMVTAHRLLASAYVGQALADELTPLRERVFKGLIIGALSESPSGLTVDDLVQSLKGHLPLTLGELRDIVQDPLADLVRRGIVSPDGALFRCDERSRALDADLESLVTETVERARVRSGVTLRPVERNLVLAAITQLVLERGWDLGAQFAGASVATGVTYGLVHAAVEAHRGRIDRHTAAVIAESIYDLLNAPDDAQAEVLTRVGRLAFGIDVVLQHGRTALLRRETLPRRVYLDASFLLPAVAPGHPFHSAYRAALDTWQKAARASALDPQLVIPDEYLDEVVNHRRLAIQQVAELGLDDRTAMEKHVSFYSAHNGNVFVSAYSASGGNQTFTEWLATAAPYTSIPSLKVFLQALGIDSMNVRRQLERDYVDYSPAYRALSTALSNAEGTARRPPILIQHDALVLTLIGKDIDQGQQVMFVTADNRVRRASVGPVLGSAGYATMSGVGFVSFVDFFVGLGRPDPSSVSRLFWGVRYLDDEADTLLHIRSYLTNLALRTYDAAMVMELPQVLESVAREAAAEAQLAGVKLGREDQAVGTQRLLDRFENRFFERMRAAIEEQSKR